MPLNKNTPTLIFLACFKYIAHAPTIETYTLSLSFQNLVHVYLRFVSKTHISLESYFWQKLCAFQVNLHFEIKIHKLFY